MKDEKIKSDIQVFICNHHRDDSESCAEKGGKELTDDLKKWAKENHKGELKVYRSGCLGKCSEGIAIACYPEKKFLLDVKADDIKEIKDMLKKALKD